MHLSELCSNNSRLKGEIEELKASGLPIVVFGTGKFGVGMANWLEAYAVSVESFCETSVYYRPGKFVYGKPVFEYESLSKHYDKCNLILAASGKGVLEIWKNIKEPVNKVYYFNYLTPVYGDVKMTPEWINEHIAEFDETYHLLSDEASRQVLLSYLDERAHCLKNPVRHLFELYTSGEYFNDLYDPIRYNHNTLVDCGAYTGDTAEQFLAFLNSFGRTGEVLAFEPDEKNFKVLESVAERVKATEMGVINCFPYGVGGQRETILFETGQGIESHCLEKNLDQKNIVQIQVVALDDILKDTMVSMIKMDIEGSELAALEGAQRIITEQMPFLAICVYHRDDDLISIPQYIQKLSQRAGRMYKFYLRHHSEGLYDTLLYAVPQL